MDKTVTDHKGKGYSSQKNTFTLCVEIEPKYWEDK